MIMVIAVQIINSWHSYIMYISIHTLELLVFLGFIRSAINLGNEHNELP